MPLLRVWVLFPNYILLFGRTPLSHFFQKTNYSISCIWNQRVKKIAFIGSCLFFFFAFSTLNAQIKIEFSPTGEVKKPSQIRARFSESMIPLGNPKFSLFPFEIRCPLQGAQRWVDDKNWVLEFPELLPGGIECTFETKKVKSVSGNFLNEGEKFSFHTGGPELEENHTFPYEGIYIDEDQIFILNLDTDLDRSSANDSIYFVVEGLKDKIGFSYVKDSVEKEILKTRTIQKTDRMILIKPDQKFPSGQKVYLVLEKGLKSKSGIPRSSTRKIEYSVRQTFRAEFNCDRVNAKAACIPSSPLILRFNSPVLVEILKKIQLQTNDGKTIPAKVHSENGDYQYEVSFPVPLSPKSKFQILLPSGIKDDAGRTLSNQSSFPLTVFTDDYPPLLKFASKFGILERFPEAILPVTIRNLEAENPVRLYQVKTSPDTEDKIKEQFDKLKEKGKEILNWAIGKEEKSNPPKQFTGKELILGSGEIAEILRYLKTIEDLDHKESIFESFQDKSSTNDIKLQSNHGARRFEVVGIPLKKPGFHVVEMKSDILGNSLLGINQPFYVRTSALVTNLALHFKWGNESSLVWVTKLNDSKPVPNADIQIFNCKKEKIFTGKTGPYGTLIIKGILAKNKIPHCSWKSYENGLFLIASFEDDFTFTHTGWQNGIENWRFNLPSGDYGNENVVFHPILDRTLFRAGEIASIKLVSRTKKSFGFEIPGQNQYPTFAKIVHSGSNKEYSISLKWDREGTSSFQFKIPKEASLGAYQIILSPSKDRGEFSIGEFRVEEFRVPLMKADIQTSGSNINPSKLGINGNVRYLSGGGAGKLPVLLRTRVTFEGGAYFSDYSDFSFSNGKVNQTEIREESNIGFTKTQLTLDEKGFFESTVRSIPESDTTQKLETELEYRDPNGEIQSVYRSFPIYPSQYHIGIASEGWAAVQDSIKLKVAVLDLKGTTVEGKKVNVTAFTKKYYSNRKRLVGGFYSYEHKSEVKELGEFCSGKTNSKGLFYCNGSLKTTGEVYFEASLSGEEVKANSSVWITGKDDLWFAASDHDRMDLIPEKKEYQTGEKAKFQVRMPFREATALVTVEREGILNSYIRNLSGKEPVIEIPIESSFAPNVFVSVLAVRGRVDSPKETALVDLAKPSFRLGMAQIRVGWKPFEVPVRIETDKTVYGTRQKVKVKIQIDHPSTQVKKDSKITLVAVDQGLLELKSNDTWDLLKAMMNQRGNSVQTSTAQLHVVGRRHFGLKSLPPGGGGGGATTRELFDTLLFWKPDLKPDENGFLEVEIPLNDSLTSFKIVAIVHSGKDKFGSGSTQIRTTKDVLIYPSIAPFAREKDEILSGISLKNTTERNLELEISPRTSPDLKLETKNIQLKAGESKNVYWNLSIPIQKEEIVYEFQTKETGGTFTDIVRFRQKVGESIPVRILQSTFLRLEDGKLSLPVQENQEAIAGSGQLEISLKSSLTGGAILSSKEYMNLYPYSCLEQKLSKAISSEKDWEHIMNHLNTYLDGDGLLKFFPMSLYGSEILTSYVLILSSESGKKIPEEIQNTLLEALNRYVNGLIYRNSYISNTDFLLKKIILLDAISRFQTVGDDTIRTIQVDPKILPTDVLISLRNIYSKSRIYKNQIPQLDILLKSRFRIQGTSYNFVDETSLWWLLSSNDSTVMKTILSVVKDPSWKEDLPRLIRGAISRQSKGHWDITTANALGILAFQSYSKQFEKDTVEGTTVITLENHSNTLEWKNQKEPTKLKLPMPHNAQNLEFVQNGSGKPYAVIHTKAALPLKEKLESGMRLEKEILDESGNKKTRFQEGDMVRVRLKIYTESDLSWIALKDPIPAGASILGSGLGNDSRSESELAKEENWWSSPTFIERKWEGYIAYFEYLPSGSVTLEYVYRINQTGKFILPPTRVEAMYLPDQFAELPNPDQMITKE
ncbi:MG2 domain-containing protein [Leptospira kirschneri]|nr:MG2 domain-containing protein [Leptospira kirschneri]EKQ81828.1 alpha-2-macroglobulin family protein [Leptospira kirschneri serovar Grippotyphosa str. Moskva]EKR10022.1 alpha-2-macroglobulin family protein [Leptospira kirschneri serovar Valbuzzi str. 200702274]OOV48048.1 peptidase inhibitor [Leptospira kirschneri serovar Grippotyphosa]UZW34776.1 MG2 domain-containing protein [Leptospira kirschneri]WHO98481.1 MG2 domain-containing protein [Leptospira kirschneri]